jgi:hypothetical protein
MGKYLEPYSDEEMVYEALLTYSLNRLKFAKAISEEGFLDRNGKSPTKEEITFAMKAAEQADRLTAYAKEKVESPIIVMQ